jgi:hypothetical protein
VFNDEKRRVLIAEYWAESILNNPARLSREERKLAIRDAARLLDILSAREKELKAFKASIFYWWTSALLLGLGIPSMFFDTPTGVIFNLVSTVLGIAAMMNDATRARTLDDIDFSRDVIQSVNSRLAGRG